MVTVNVAFVPEAPTRSTGAPVAVYEIRVHDVSMVVFEVVMRVVVQVGVWDWTVMDPAVPNAQPLTAIVVPPVVDPSDHESVAVGVDDESVNAQLVTFCAVTVVVEQPALLAQLAKVRVESAIELEPSAIVAVPVTWHDREMPLIESVPVPVPVILHVVPVTHVTDAEAGEVAAPSAATSTTTATRVVRRIGFTVRCPFPGSVGRRVGSRQAAREPALAGSPDSLRFA